MTSVVVKTAAVTNELKLPYAEVGGKGGTAVVFVHAWVESWRYLQPLQRRAGR